MPGERTEFLRGALSAVREAFATMRPGRRTRPPVVCSAPALQMQQPGNLVRAAAAPLTAASARKASLSVLPTYFSGSLVN